MAAKICVLGLILSSSPYLRSALGGDPLYEIQNYNKSSIPSKPIQ